MSISLQRLPFDLHVLCAPPAFILSQDQTLYLIFKFLTHLNFYFLIFFDLLFGTFLFLENHRLVFSLKDSIVYFSMYFFVCSLCVNETYFSIPFSYCQYFFKIFLKYFFISFLRQNKKLVIDVFFYFLFLLFTNSCVLFFNIFVCCSVQLLS